jgi:hypothetical protein
LVIEIRDEKIYAERTASLPLYLQLRGDQNLNPSVPRTPLFGVVARFWVVKGSTDSFQVLGIQTRFFLKIPDHGGGPSGRKFPVGRESMDIIWMDGNVIGMSCHPDFFPFDILQCFSDFFQDLLSFGGEIGFAKFEQNAIDEVERE